MKSVSDLPKVDKNDIAIAGGKGASLGEMTRVGIPVPPGFVILSDAFEKFIKKTDLNVEIDAVLDTVNHEKMHTVENASEKIQALIINAEIPRDIVSEIKKSFKKLKTKYVAVRSSATSEDSSTASWAGQLDTFLNTTQNTLLENVKKCWASLFTPRAIFYRFEKSLHKEKISVAVVVQKMIISEESGIAFSVHPVTEDKNQLFIEAVFGLGEAIVSGKITPDSYVVDKQDWHIIDINVNEQAKGLFKAKDGGSEWKELGKEGEKQVLSDKEMIELAKLIAKIEKHYGFPVDVEWAKEKRKFYILQSRPITTLIHDREVKEEENWYHLGKWVEPALAAEVWLEYSKYAQQFFEGKLDGKILYINGDFFLSQHDVDIIKKESYEAAKNRDAAFFERLKNVCVEVSDRIVRKSKEIKDVSKFLEDYQELTGVWMPLNIVSIGVEEFVNETDSNAFSLAKGETAEEPWTLKQVDEMRELKKELGDNYDEISEEIKSKLNSHVKKYEWKGSHHFSIHKFTFEELLKQMKEDKKDESKVEGNVNGALIELLDLMGFIRFRCAEASGISTYNLSKYLIKIAKDNGMIYSDIVEHTMDEIKEGKISKNTVEKRKKNTGFIFDKEKRILSDEEIEKYMKWLLKDGGKEFKEIKGTIACKGKASGRVKLVRSKEEMKGFKKGMVLVAYETTPDIIIIMKQASAIVTDFGGLTSHAAIISREFNIPCIVGTQNATNILKNGDLVEVNAHKGIIRILKRNS